MSTALPQEMYEIFAILAALIRLLGLVVFGLGIGWFALEVLRKGQQAWQLQIAVFLGFVGLAIAMTYFVTAGALGAFGIGVGVAMFLWGMPKAKPREEGSEEEKARGKK